MIRLWNSTETTFRGNRWVLNETTKCDVTEVVNGEFAVDIEYPLKDNKDLSKNFLRGNLITCPVADERPEQQFRIRKVDKTSNGVVAYAQAKLIADLGSNYIRAMTITGKTIKEAIEIVLNAALDPHNFKVGTLSTNPNVNVIVNIPEGTVLNALIGKENSILSEYGGEFIINNNTFDIVDSRGANRKFRIAYGKNIASIKETIDDTDLATVLIPKSGDYRLPEYVIESPKVANYEKRYFQEVEMNLDIWDGTDEQGEDQITIAEAYALMRTTCNNMFLKDKVDQLSFNYEIDLISLRKTEEYKNYNIVEKVYLGDTVTVNHKLLNVDLEGNVNKTIYNVLLDKYKTVEIGFAKQDITDIIKTAVKSIQFAKDEINLQITNTAKHITSAFTLADGEIKQSIVDLDNELTTELDLQNGKISAVVESNDGGMTWQLSKNAFKVACVGSSGASVTIDEYGLTVDDGKFKIKKNGSTVFYVNTSGRCTADGGFIVDDGDSRCKIDSYGISITNDNGYTGTLYVDSSSTTLSTNDDLEVWGTLRAQGTLRAYAYTHCYDNLDVDLDTYIDGDLDVNGTKNCLQTTENYGKRRINAYETAENYFGDIGEGVIENGQCVVPIEPIFKECINTDIPYQVFLQTYNGSVTGVERNSDNFIVKGSDGTTFAWELKAKRKGYENVRLEELIINKEGV